MPEQKMTYQERVRFIAIEMATAEGISRGRYSEPHWEILMQRFDIYAKVAIAAQAEAIILREWGTVEKYNDWFRNNNPAALNTQKYLLEHGYTPKTNKDGK